MRRKYIWSLGILGLAVFISFNLLTFFRVHKLQSALTEQIAEQRQALAEAHMLKKNLLANIRLEQMKFDLLSQMPEDSGRIVILFPNEICDICYRDLFGTLKELSDKKKERIVAVVPVRFNESPSYYLLGQRPGVVKSSRRTNIDLHYGWRTRNTCPVDLQQNGIVGERIYDDGGGLMSGYKFLFGF